MLSSANNNDVDHHHHHDHDHDHDYLASSGHATTTANNNDIDHHDHNHNHLASSDDHDDLFAAGENHFESAATSPESLGRRLALCRRVIRTFGETEVPD